MTDSISLWEKICIRCGKPRSIDDYYSTGKNKEKKQSVCRFCEIERVGRRVLTEEQRQRKLVRDRFRQRTSGRNLELVRDYNITDEQYEAMFAAQNGVCAICGEPERLTIRDGSIKKLAVDHNHKTGQVRGLLCSYCNLRLGKFEQEREVFEPYLERYSQVNSEERPIVL